MREADFWRDILSTLLPTTAPTGSVLPVKPNRLRISMREFWGYNEVDTDVMMKLFVAPELENYPFRYVRRALKKKLVRIFSGRSRK